MSGNRVNGPGGDLRIESRRLQLAMSEQDLDDTDIGTVLQKMGGKAVPQGVRADTLVDTDHIGSFLNLAIKLPRGDWIGAATPRKQPPVRQHHAAPTFHIGSMGPGDRARTT